MTLEQLRIFVAVAECEHVTAAAAVLHLTQSAVSAAIHALERRHDVDLFARVGRRIVLTEAGRLFLAEARAVLAQAATAEASLADLTGLKRGSLKIAASQTVGNYWLPARLVRFRKQYPGISITLQLGNSEAVREMLQDHTIDLGFVEDAVRDAHITTLAVARDSLAVVVPPALKPEGKITPAKLMALPWVFRERGSGTRTIFEDYMKSAGVKPGEMHIVLEAPSNEAVTAAAMAGAGATALSRLAVQHAIDNGTLSLLPVTLPERQFFLLHAKTRSLPKAATAFIDMVTPGEA